MKPIINYQMIKDNLSCRTTDMDTASQLLTLGWEFKLSTLGELL